MEADICEAVTCDTSVIVELSRRKAVEDLPTSVVFDGMAESSAAIELESSDVVESWHITGIGSGD